MPPKIFTLDEANSALSTLKTIFSEFNTKHEALIFHQDRINEMYAGSEIESYLQDEFKREQNIVKGLYDDLNFLVKEIQEVGCELKDPYEGLVDFLSIRDGQYVYLCWKYGEEKINFWHGLYDGIKGRKPV